MEGIDFGNQVLRPGSIHGTKWFDANGNGRREDDEPGLPGVTIYLDANINGQFDADERHTVTMEDDPDTPADESGMYWFDEVEIGQHWVGEVIPEGQVQTFPRPNFFLPLPGDLPAPPDPGGISLPPPFLPLNPGHHLVFVGSGQTVEGIDFGNAEDKPGIVQGTKWEDRNGNGRREPNEPGLGGVVIYSDLNGNRMLDDDEPRTVTQADVADTEDDEAGRFRLGTETGRASHTRGRAGRDSCRRSHRRSTSSTFCSLPPRPFPLGEHQVVLGPGQTVEGIDFGNRPIERRPEQVTGTKWLDLDGNGQREDDEPGLPGVTVYLDLNNNNQLDSDEPRAITRRDAPNTRVDESGQYTLLAADTDGIFAVREVVPDGFQQTFPIGVRCDFPICAAITFQSIGNGHLVPIEPGETVAGIDFGNAPDNEESALVTGRKWLDTNGNGRFDSNEQGVPGVTIFADINLNGQLDRGEPRTVTSPNTNQESGGFYELEVPAGNQLILEVVAAWLRADVPVDRPRSGLSAEPRAQRLARARGRRRRDRLWQSARRRTGEDHRRQMV